MYVMKTEEGQTASHTVRINCRQLLVPFSYFKLTTLSRVEHKTISASAQYLTPYQHVGSVKRFSIAED